MARGGILTEYSVYCVYYIKNNLTCGIFYLIVYKIVQSNNE